MRNMLFGTAAALVVVAAPAIAEEIPEWDINQLCAASGDKHKCVGAEFEARRILSDRWIATKPAIQKDCLSSLTSDQDKTFSKLGGCVATKLAAEAAAKKAADEAAAKKAAEEAAAKKAAAEAAAKAAAEKKAAETPAAAPAPTPPPPAPTAPAEPPKEAPKQ